MIEKTFMMLFYGIKLIHAVPQEPRDEYVIMQLKRILESVIMSTAG